MIRQVFNHIVTAVVTALTQFGGRRRIYERLERVNQNFCCKKIGQVEKKRREVERLRKEGEQKILQQADVVMKIHSVRYGIKDLSMNDKNPYCRKRKRDVFSLSLCPLVGAFDDEANKRHKNDRGLQRQEGPI